MVILRPKFTSLAKHEVNQTEDHLDPVGEGCPRLERVLHAVVGRVVAEAHRGQRDERKVRRSHEVPFFPCLKHLLKERGVFEFFTRSKEDSLFLMTLQREF